MELWRGKVSRCEAFTVIMLDTGYREGTMNRIGTVRVMLICNMLEKSTEA
jgi:hypothetical protein